MDNLSLPVASRLKPTLDGTLWPFALSSGAFAFIFAAIAPAYAHRYALSSRAAAGIYCCLLLQLILIILPATHGSRERVRSLFANRPYFFLLVWYLPYLIYAAGTSDFRTSALLHLLAIAAPVLTVYLVFPVRDPRIFVWQDAFVAVLLVTVALSHSLAGVWNVPVNLDFIGRLFLVSVASWSWIFVRTLPGIGYHLAISLKILKAAALNFIYFAIIALPGGLMIHFTRWNPRWRGPTAFFLDYLEILLFVAVLEELFFRGFLQNLVANSIGSPLKAQALVACLFGLFHILHAPFPNWRYIALASIAGWFYGSAFRTTGSLMASSLLHAAVDTVWRTWFSRS